MADSTSRITDAERFGPTPVSRPASAGQVRGVHDRGVTPRITYAPVTTYTFGDQVVRGTVVGPAAPMQANAPSVAPQRPAGQLGERGWIVPHPGSESDPRAAKLFIPEHGPPQLIPRLLPPPSEAAQREALRPAPNYRDDAISRVSRLYTLPPDPELPLQEYIDRGLGLTADRVAQYRRSLGGRNPDSDRALIERFSPIAREQLRGMPASETVAKTMGILEDAEHMGNYRLWDTLISDAIMGAGLQALTLVPVSPLLRMLGLAGKAMTAVNVGTIAVNVARGKGLSEQDQLALLTMVGPGLLKAIAGAAASKFHAQRFAAGFEVDVGHNITANGTPTKYGRGALKAPGGSPHLDAEPAPARSGARKPDAEVIGEVLKAADQNFASGIYRTRTLPNGGSEASVWVAHPLDATANVKVTIDSSGKLRMIRQTRRTSPRPPVESMNAEKNAFATGSPRFGDLPGAYDAVQGKIVNDFMDPNTPVVGQRTHPRGANTVDRATQLEWADYSRQLAAGSIGIQRPGVVNLGGPDSIVYHPARDMIQWRDTKGRGPGGSFPREPTRNEVRRKWGAEATQATMGTPGNPNSGFKSKWPKLDAKIRAALKAGRWEYVQVNERIPALPSTSGPMSDF